MNILVAGDFAPRGETAVLIDKGLFDAVLGQVVPITANVDYSVVNLEAPIIKGTSTPIQKTGPVISCTEKALDAVKYAGFDCVTLANNHFFDQSNQGVADTIDGCLKRNLDYVGGGRDINEASSILYKKIGGNSLAIINCCEKEFSIADENHGGSNPMDPVRIFYSIKEAKKNADYVLVITHGGIECYQYPYPQMQELYRFFVDAGADAVVNHHQHCPSGYEKYHGKFIFYGLGNFCFEKQTSDFMWQFGYMVVLSFEGENVSCNLHYYAQSLPHELGIVVYQNSIDWPCFNMLQNINAEIVNPKIVYEKFEEYIDKVQLKGMQKLEPFQNTIILYLQKKNLFPHLLKGKVLLAYLNRLSCSAHNAVCSSIIKRQLKA